MRATHQRPPDLHEKSSAATARKASATVLYVIGATDSLLQGLVFPIVGTMALYCFVLYCRTSPQGEGVRRVLLSVPMWSLYLRILTLESWFIHARPVPPYCRYSIHCTWAELWLFPSGNDRTGKLPYFHSMPMKVSTRVFRATQSTRALSHAAPPVSVTP